MIMRRLFYLLFSVAVLFLLAPSYSGAKTSASLSDIEEQIRHAEYQISWTDTTVLPNLASAYQAPNRAHNLRSYFTTDGIYLVPRDEDSPSWQVKMQLLSVGEEAVIPAPFSVSGNRLEHERADFVQWVVNDEDGLRQGVEILSAPAKRELAFSVSGLNAHRRLDGESIELSTQEDVTVLHLSDWAVKDALGKRLSSEFSLLREDEATLIRLRYDDNAAVYPITVAPLLVNSDWEAFTKQKNAQFGFSVASAGDVNGDKYDDVIIGAPYYDNGQRDEGRVFVYLGSP